VTQAAVAAEVHETLDAHVDFTAEVTLNGELGHRPAERFELFFGQRPDAGRFGDIGRIADLAGPGTTDTEDVRERDDRVLVVRDVHTRDTSHSDHSSLAGQSRRKKRGILASDPVQINRGRVCRGIFPLSPDAACDGVLLCK
jgi:hypothetical protein